jgi:hypothetical protein
VFHIRVGVLETLFELFVGDLRIGAAGGAGAAVVKLQTADQLLVP